MKKILVIMLAVTILGLLFAGCGEISRITAPGTTETECVNCLSRTIVGKTCIDFESTGLNEGASIEEIFVDGFLEIELEGEKSLYLVKQETANDDYLA
jgi:hypothetical protein